jgi:hypothetical protein
MIEGLVISMGRSQKGRDKESSVNRFALIAFGSLVAPCFCGWLNCRAVFAADSLDRIRQAYVEHVHSLQSISVDYRVGQSLDKSVLGESRAAPSNLMHKHWVRDAERWVHRMDPFLFPGSNRPVADYHSFDGEDAWQVSYTGADATDIQEIAKFHGFRPWSKPKQIEPERLLGMMLSDSGESLENLFDRPAVRFLGVEPVG